MRVLLRLLIACVATLLLASCKSFPFISFATQSSDDAEEQR